MKILFSFIIALIFTLTLGSSLNAQQTDDQRLDELVKLYICTEKSPELCSYFGLDFNEAIEDVYEECGSKNSSLAIEAVNGEMSDIICVQDLPSIDPTIVPVSPPAFTPEPLPIATPAPMPTITPEPTPTVSIDPVPTATPEPTISLDPTPTISIDPVRNQTAI